MHGEVMSATGGLRGIRDRGLIASALAAVQTFWHYSKAPPSLFVLAARLAYGLAKNHGFMDGNKRTAFIAAYTFLAMNGVVIQANQQDVVEAMETLASSIDEPDSRSGTLCALAQHSESGNVPGASVTPNLFMAQRCDFDRP